MPPVAALSDVASDPPSLDLSFSPSTDRLLGLFRACSLENGSIFGEPPGGAKEEHKMWEERPREDVEATGDREEEDLLLYDRLAGGCSGDPEQETRGRIGEHGDSNPSSVRVDADTKEVGHD